MELRGQDDDMRTSSYSHQSIGVERRRDGNHNGNSNTTTILTYTQTLDHHRTPRSPNSDRFSTVSKGSNSKIRYRECLRNHAASVGGNVFDGCGEFMPGGEEGSLEALKCAACECHRNFHRKQVDGETQFSPTSRRANAMVHSLQLPPPLPSPTVLHHQRYSMGLHSNTSPTAVPNLVQPMTVAYGGGGGGTESSSEDLNVFHSNADGVPPPPPYVLSKKRFRTKFSQDQKIKMMEFAEKVGWRINKQDEEEVNKFCAEVGVRRQVFKVWMHNNKTVRRNLQEHEHEHGHEQEQQEPL